MVAIMSKEPAYKALQVKFEEVEFDKYVTEDE